MQRRQRGFPPLAIASRQVRTQVLHTAPPHSLLHQDNDIKTARFSLVKQLNIPALLLLAIGAGLIAIHLTLNLRAEKSSHLALSIVFWLAACSTLWDKRYQFKLGSGIVPFLFGTLLIAGILLKSGTHPSEKFL